MRENEAVFVDTGAWISLALSRMDASSFVLMSHEKIRAAFTFDHHFAMVGFRLVG
jgi:predicted nucleic acid-binding protein